MRTLRKAKKGISPVIATIILIAITIVIAIAVAAWVFGLFKSYSGNANGVTILSGVSSCYSDASSSGKSDECIIVLSNQGSNSVSVIGASVNGQQASVVSATPVPANGQATITVSFTSGIITTAGQTVNVAIALNNGATVTTTLIAS